MNACVFCSANDGLPAAVLAEVAPFVRELKARNGTLLYGGGRAGLMGVFADTALGAGVPVRGAITQKLSSTIEVAHRGLDELVIVPDLFARKRWFLQESDIFFVFPGGFGTLDEALEVITWYGLGELDKPVVFVNIDGFWDATLAAFRDLKDRGVIRAGALESIHTAKNSADAWRSVKKGSLT